MIVVTAPTGQIGRGVVAHLLDAGVPVRVVARDPARLAPGVAGRVEVVRGSHGDPAVVAEAFAGADAVFWLAGTDREADGAGEAYAGFTRPAAEAFATHEVARVVGVSVLGRGRPGVERAGAIPAALAMDDLIARSGVAFRALTMSYFMDNVLFQLDPIRDGGAFSFPSRPDRSFPVVATRDIAAVAADLLRDDTWTGAEEVPVLGPEDLTYADMAAIMSEVLGRPISYRQSTYEAYRAELARHGYSEPMARDLADMARVKNDGLDDGIDRTTSVTAPTTFRRWCVEVLRPAVRR